MGWDQAITAALQVAGGIGDKIYDHNQSMREWDRQSGLQREFAQHGIQWRVADAKAAGIHPIVAMGANVQSGKPIPIGMQSDTFSRMGQNIGETIAEYNRIKLEQEKVKLLMMRRSLGSAADWHQRHGQTDVAKQEILKVPKIVTPQGQTG